jgi:hypothetical protein
MKTNKPSNIIVAVLFAAVLVLSQRAAEAFIAGPYTADANTLHLWHMDAANVPITDNVAAGGVNLVALLGTTAGAALGTASYFPAFGNVLNTIDGGQGGTAATDKDAFLAASTGNVTITLADPTTGAFTMEAVLLIGFDPTKNLGPTANGGNGRGSPCIFLSGDGNANPNRIFQFRVTPKYCNAANDNTTINLEFNNINAGGTLQTISFPVPTSGPDAIALYGYYHVAVVYNGAANTAGNITLYWTAMDPSRTSASLLGSAQMTSDLPVGTTIFGVGNNGRTPQTANFLGYIDEVRISKIARAADGMMFTQPPPTITSQPADQTVGLGQSVRLSVMVMVGATNWVTTSYANGSQGPVNFKYAYHFLQTEVLGSLLNNYTGYRGMQVTVGAHPITVTGLARYFQTGNTQTHTLKLVLASTGADVPGSSVTWSPAGPYGLHYVALAKPVTLAANTAYYVVSSETSGGDTWYSNLSITGTSAATVTGTVYGNGGTWTKGASANHCDGTVSFMYTSPQP